LFRSLLNTKMTEQTAVVLLELINLKSFVPQWTSASGESSISTEQVESAVLLANNKLLEIGIQQAEEKLLVTYTGGQLSSDDVDDSFSLRNQMPDIYNVLWDFCLAQDKIELDCRVFMNTSEFKSKAAIIKENKVQLVINAGTLIDSACLARSALPKSVNLMETSKDLMDYVGRDRYMLYDHYLTNPMPKYEIICLGGTFDQLHNGHKKLLTVAMHMCTKKLIIGVTGTEMLQKKKNRSMIQSLEERMGNVENFVHSMRTGITFDICELMDPWGPAIVLPEIQAIVVSR